MIEEIVFTSAKRGLETGKTGFCTVAATPNMSANLLRFLEASSGYRHLKAPGHADNPVVRSHVKAVLVGQQQHVISRVGDAGMDYSQRSNKIAHHIAFNDIGSFDSGPVGLMWNDQNFVKEWDEDPRFLSPRMLAGEPGFPSPCSTWEAVAGDAGRAGDLLEAFLNMRTIYLVLEPTDPAIELIDEAINILPPDRRWDFTFSTFFTRTPPNVECQVRVVFPDSPELTTARRSSKNVIIDTRDKQRSSSKLAAFAREGRSIEVGVSDQQVHVAANEESGSPRKSVVVAPQNQGSVRPPVDTAPPTLASNSPDIPAKVASVPTPQYGKLLLVVGVALLLLVTIAAGVWAPTIGSRNTAENDMPGAVSQTEGAQQAEGQPNESQHREEQNSVPKESEPNSLASFDKVEEVTPDESDDAPQTDDGALREDRSDIKSDEDSEQISDPEPGDQKMSSGADGKDEGEEMSKATTSQPALKLNASKFGRFVLTKEWNRLVNVPVKVFDSSLSIEDFQKCKICLVTLGDDPREINSVEVERSEHDGSELKEWKFNAFDGAEEVTFLKLAIKKSSEGRVVGTLVSKSEYLGDVGDGKLPELNELALQVGGVKIPLIKVREPQPEKISPKHDGKAKQPFGNADFDQDIQIKIYARPRYLVTGNNSSAASFRIDFEELELAEPKDLITNSLPDIEFGINVSFNGIVKLTSLIPSSLENEDSFKNRGRVSSIAVLVKDKLKKRRDDLGKTLDELEKDLAALDLEAEKQRNKIKKKIKSVLKKSEKVDKGLAVLDGGNESPAQKALGEYFNEILIPVEIFDKDGQTLAVTVLYFQEGKAKSGKGAAETQLGKLTLDVHEANNDREGE